MKDVISKDCFERVTFRNLPNYKTKSPGLVSLGFFWLRFFRILTSLNSYKPPVWNVRRHFSSEIYLGPNHLFELFQCESPDSYIMELAFRIAHCIPHLVEFFRLADCFTDDIGPIGFPQQARFQVFAVSTIETNVVVHSLAA